MNIVYYKYFVHNKDHRHQFKLLPILKNFCKIKKEKFRRSFRTPTEDNLFLFHIDVCTFMLVVTKNQEIIKTISKNTMKHEDIYDKLQSEESLGFASYIFVGDNYYGIASTFFGPKNSYWTHLLNQIFVKLKIDKYLFESVPFPVDTSKKEALKFSFKGQTTIKMNNANPLFKDVLGLFGVSGNEAKSISIEIKPEPHKEMAKSFDAITKDIPLEGIDKFMVRGKEFHEDSMTNYYIIGSGHICDSLDYKRGGDIVKVIENKVVKNRKLKAATEEFKNDGTYKKKNIPNITRFNDLDNWNDFL